MKWGEWLVRFRALARASLVLEHATDELTMLSAHLELGPTLRDELQKAAIACIQAKEKLRVEGAAQLGDKRHLEQQMTLPEVGQ